MTTTTPGMMAATLTVAPIETHSSSRPDGLTGSCGEALATLAALLDAVLPNPLAGAAQLLHRFGSLGAVLVAGEHSLMSVPGLTPTAARLLGAAHAATSFALRERVERDGIGSTGALNEWLRARLAFCTVERALGLFLDSRNGLIRCDVLAEGTTNCLPLYPREVAVRALQLGASAVILAHNHPSGDTDPSRLDQETTRDVAAALLTIGIVLHDHVIVARERIISMRQLGLL